MDEAPVKQKRGFALLSAKQRKAIARSGGKSIPPEKRAFSVNRELASAAGKVGGKGREKAPMYPQSAISGLQARDRQ